ncbi:HAD-IIB family hydrolase [Ornithinibacillus sp. FSL M8-0202]|uniref:HAD-IIB family hydrolase n=1 Tax=Ornithinibacillus sp. FSL M8-0202 TaxID=2921616 RepID=UPI0030CC14DA
MDFVFDIDGTICFDGKTIDSSIIEALDELTKCGHDIIFASARPIRDLVPVLPAQLQKGKLVGGNGCYISEDGKITTNYFHPDVIEPLHNLIQTYQLTYLADGEWDYSYTGSQNHPIYHNINQSSARNRLFTDLEKICKLVLFNPTKTVLDELTQLPVSITAYKKENAIDISPLGVNKVHGLNRLHVTDFISFGNDSNDQCLFENAKYSVCVGDHHVQAYASMTITKEQVANTIIKLGISF